MVIALPLGTLVRDAETGKLLCDVYADGEKHLIARGGKGGKGNVRFTTSRRHAPHFAQKGQKTQPHALILELKVIADVGIIGFPNVGKSTLLSKISAAKAQDRGVSLHHPLAQPRRSCAGTTSPSSRRISPD